MAGAGKRTEYRFIKLLTCICLAVCLFGAAGGALAAEEQGAGKDAGAGTKGQGLITINMVNADIRDILSAIAISMDVNIIYLEKPYRVSFSAKDIAPVKALELLIQSTDSESGQTGYLRDGNLIIVGSQEKLQKDFFNQMALTRFRLSYISPETLSEQLDKLGVPVQKIVLDKGSRFIWAQGTPQSLSKVASVIAALDRAENFDDNGAIKSGIDLTKFDLNYITADRLEKLILQLNIQAQVIRVDTNARVLWASGTEQQLADIGQLILNVDVADSAGASFTMAPYTLRYLSYDKLVGVTTQLDSPIQIIRVGIAQKKIWLKGTQKDIDDTISLITQLDYSDNSDEGQFFVYKLVNISPTDAAAKMAFINLKDVEVMTLNYPQLSHELLIKCPVDMISTVSRTVSFLDVQGQKIKAPVDYSGSYNRLTKRKELLGKLLNIPSSSMYISDNVSRTDDESYYVMWVEDTPDNIKKIKEMIALIDKP